MLVSHRNRGEKLIDVYARLITIFDCKIDMAWEGLASDGTEVKGRVVVPEVSHEVTVDRLSDYVVCDGPSIKAKYIQINPNNVV